MRPSLLVRRATEYLSRSGIDSPEVTAELLLESVLATDRAGLYTRDTALSGQEARAFGRALCRRSRGVPLEHITHEREFRGLRLAVRQGSFIPRVETELLVDLALGLLEGSAEPVVVDVGTGSGAIALAIASERDDARVFAVDIGPESVRLARENAAALSLPVDVIRGDLLAPLPEDLRGRVDLVVSNPPYVPVSRRAGLSAEARRDPDRALFTDGRLLARLASEASEWLAPGGSIAVEIDDDRGGEAAAVLRAGFEDVRVERDLAGRERFVLGRLR